MRTASLDALMSSVRPHQKPTGAPFALAGRMMGAQANGAESARTTVPAILAGLRTCPAQMSALPHLVEASIEAGTAVLRQAEMSEAEVHAWRLGFIRGANPLVQAFVRELEAGLSELNRRPSDFGCLPQGPRLP